MERRIVGQVRVKRPPNSGLCKSDADRIVMSVPRLSRWIPLAFDGMGLALHINDLYKRRIGNHISEWLFRVELGWVCLRGRHGKIF